MDISIRDLLLAYRKVKVDLYYSGLPCRSKLLDFELQLEPEIRRIKKLLETQNRDALRELCVGYLLIPKKVCFKEQSNQGLQGSNARVVFSNPVRMNSFERIKRCQLRLVSDLPIAFHVIMTWWVMKIGERLEREVSKRSYGNRIRRLSNGEQSKFSLGTFVPYLSQYRAWQNGSLKVIRNAIENDRKEIAVVATDFCAFYHTVDPDFLLEDRFYEDYFETCAGLTAEERAYTDLVVWMIKEWAGTTPLKRGLPVGCSISAIIANLALLPFDKEIEKNILPLYYGRYVDDVILVLENTNHYENSIEIWQWLAKRIDGLDVSCFEGGRQKTLCYSNEVISPKKGRSLTLGADKTKIFIMDPRTGGLLLNSLERQIRLRSSEWRALPEIPEAEDAMAAKILSACNAAGEEVENLCKVDVLSLRRAVFAMTTRDFESYGRNLTPNGWKKIRVAFLNLIDKHFTDVRSFFDFHRYIPRIIATACNCLSGDDEDESELVISIIEKLFSLISNLAEQKIPISIAGGYEMGLSDGIALLQKYLVRAFEESIVSSVSIRPEMGFLCQLKQRIAEFNNCFSRHGWEDLYAHDLAYQPARTAYTKERIGYFEYRSEFRKNRIFRNICFLPTEWVASINGFAQRVEDRKKGDDEGVDISLVFPTRPLNTFELSEMFWNPYQEEDRKVLSDFLVFERGLGWRELIFPRTTGKDGDQTVTSFRWYRRALDVNVALANWKTKADSFNASICQVPDPDEICRYNRLMRLVNEIIASGVKVDYVVFPELSIPRKWFDQMALKLKVSGVSMIAGVEYIHECDKHVRNQVWCSLLHDAGGFRMASVYKFEKVRAARHEAEELYIRGGCTMTSNVLKGRKDVRPIVRHGDFASFQALSFSVVVCSDLTNVDYRSQLRGKIDVLFVPSWNQDAQVFSSLVESAAYDIHTYIVQCNDRAYGDTRIRVPDKETYNRDLIKIKGGARDYFVIGRLDVERLRRFQSYSVSPVTGKSATFKPVPSGFEISKDRRILPQ